MMPTAAGYSGTPLAHKLGIKAASRVFLCGAPEGFAGLPGPLPDGVVFEAKAGLHIDIAHVFVVRQEDLAEQLALPLGWVDIKVCAVSEVWSGLKLVVRKELR
jgi:hypothetical protein